MNKDKRMITPFLERKAFEDIIRKTFQRYKDNLMCSQDTMEDIVREASKEIREQLQGVSRKDSS